MGQHTQYTSVPHGSHSDPWHTLKHVHLIPLPDHSKVQPQHIKRKVNMTRGNETNNNDSVSTDC